MRYMSTKSISPRAREMQKFQTKLPPPLCKVSLRTVSHFEECNPKIDDTSCRGLKNNAIAKNMRLASVWAL
jgi:hypothetical protein